MTETRSRSDEILDSAEKMARSGGYNGFSFRDIAAEIGIKSASVHYHFPSKEKLGAALAKRYTQRFLDGLGDPETAGPDRAAVMARYVDAYRQAIIGDGLMCLCGVLGAEADSLPETVAAEAKNFFAENARWLERALETADPSIGAEEARTRALRLIALLEGAMIATKALDDPRVFDRIVAG